MQDDTTDRLSAAERDRFAMLEAVIDRGLRTYVEVGEALAEIRDSKLYRETHATFEDYLRARWNISRSHGYRLIDAAEVAEVERAESPNGDIPKNEAQARVLVGIESLNVRAKIRERVEQNGGWAAHTSHEVERIAAEERTKERKRIAMQDYFGAVLGLHGAADTIRKVGLADLHDRRQTAFGNEQAVAWLRSIRDDAAYIVEEADAVLGAMDGSSS